jgi:hypothetical protein
VANRHRVVLLPGGVLSAEPAYAALLAAMGDRVDAVTKDLEVYSGDQPPPDSASAPRRRGFSARLTFTASTASISSATRAEAPPHLPSPPCTASGF